jgi:hypothetical protein
MKENELSERTEKGVKELNLEWPKADTMYEIKIPRVVNYDEDGQKKVQTAQEYFDFLNSNVFPVVDDLENKGEIAYWHILNQGEFLNLRISIEDDSQKKKVEKILSQHNMDEATIIKWPTYSDPNLGSRLGCQALLRLYHAQSKFTRDIVRSLFWIDEKMERDDANKLISKLTESVPIYTSRMQLNTLLFNPIYEVLAHLHEGESRLRSLVDKGIMQREASVFLDAISNANNELKLFFSY